MVRRAIRLCNCENERDYDLISRDPGFFFGQYPAYIIIDEAQEYPDLFRTLRGVIDADRHSKGRFLITGSSSAELLNNVSESLAGRVAIVELGTLKASEYYSRDLSRYLSRFYEIFSGKLSKKNVPFGAPPLTRQDMQYVWLKGGYPEPLLHSQDDIFYQQWLDNYQRTYVQRDIARLFPCLNKIAFRRFFRMLGQLSGTIINRSDFGRAIEVSESTIKDYLTIAEGTFLWRILPSYERTVSKSLIKMPKGFLRDSVLLHHFLKITTMDDLIGHIHVGHSFESFVMEEFIKTNELPFGLLINQAEEAMWLTDSILQLPVGWL